VKKISEMSAEELAGLVCETLLKAGITTTLSGGGYVAIWSEGKYVSRDLDFIEEGPVPRRKLKVALEERDVLAFPGHGSSPRLSARRCEDPANSAKPGRPIP